MIGKPTGNREFEYQVYISPKVTAMIPSKDQVKALMKAREKTVIKAPVYALREGRYRTS
jgi:hypothetical protein